MILKAKHHPVIYPFFKFFTALRIKTTFNAVHIIGSFKDSNLPILLISNHVSWWDGFWAEFLNQKLFKRKFHFMMLEEQLRKYWFFNYTGGYSVKKNSRSILESIEYSSDILSKKENVLLIFPQGEIQSMHCQSFIFEKGLERIFSLIKNPVQILFLANLVDYFSGSKPTLYSYLMEYTEKKYNIISIQNVYNKFYKECIIKQLSIKG